VADLCAAPGGKALQLAAAGARLWAVDLSRQRLARLRENRERLMRGGRGLDMQIIEADARVWRPPDLLDGVLLDAPCSALGVLRRHPEGAWRRDPRDLMRFPAIQRALLDAAAHMLKPGGRLVYCVCTPTPEEGRDLVAAAIAGGGWGRSPVSPHELPGFASALTDDGDVMTAPQASSGPEAEGRDLPDSPIGEIVADPIESDVFYIARLERAGG
jgi:16S rRNA (cytosine967-C5)-methyltransferase